MTGTLDWRTTAARAPVWPPRGLSRPPPSPAPAASPHASRAPRRTSFAARSRAQLTPPGAALLEQLTALSEGTTVSFYLLNPCAEYWEDVQDAKLSELLTESRLRERRTNAHSIDEQNDEDPFGLLNPKDPTLLRLWGRTGRELIMLITELTSCGMNS